jgi:hypothetical protein
LQVSLSLFIISLRCLFDFKGFLSTVYRIFLFVGLGQT